MTQEQELYQQYIHGEGKSPRTITAYMKDLSQFYNFMKDILRIVISSLTKSLHK